MSHCFVCGGFGKSPEPCPSCGKLKGSLNTDVITMEERNRVIGISKILSVPEQYTGVTWVKDNLLASHPEVKENFIFNSFCDNLETFHKIFAGGNIPSKSMFLSAPAKMSKTTLVYSCMQLAKSYGFSVAPYLDTVEMKRVLTLAAENPNYKLYGRHDYDKMMLADVLFVCVTKGTYLTEACNTIIDLIDRRNRLGKPVFVISRYSLNKLENYDSLRMIQYIKDMNQMNNSIKYPVIIQYVGGVKNEINNISTQ